MSCKTVKIRKPHNKNTENCYNLAPFRVNDKKLFVQPSTYEQWKGTIVMTAINEYFEEIIIKDDVLFDKPNDYGKLPDCEGFKLIYNTIFSLNNAKYWHHLVPRSSFIKLTDEECDRLLNGEREFVEKMIDTEISQIGASTYFVKTGSCSTKHDFSPQMVTSGKEALNHLLLSDAVCRSLRNRKAQGIYITPWSYNISKDTEFRVFVRNDTVVGVSQQYLYKVYCMFSKYDPLAVITAFQKLWNSFSFSDKINNVLRCECTFDGYICCDDEGDITAHLIEINGAGFGWGAPGSSLFEWETDPPPTCNEVPEYRYTVC